MTRLTMRVVSKATFGVDLGEGHEDIVEAFDLAFAFITDVTAQPIRTPLFVPTSRNQKYKAALALIKSFTDELIEQSLASGDNEGMKGQVFGALAGVERSLLRDEVVSLYFAGFETTARTMSFMMQLLGQHPDILAALRKEVDNAGDLADVASALKELPTACEIVNETLRLYPPVALLARQVNSDCEIDGYPVTADSLIIINPFMSQRDTAYWPDGETFSPDPENPLAKRLAHRGAFSPFGAGPRICLGKHFALVEMVLAISLLARDFNWDLVDKGPVEIEFHGTLRPAKPIMATMSTRSGTH